MPAATVITLRANTAGAYDFDTGAAVHGWLIDSLQPFTSLNLHTNSLFTASPLMGLPPDEAGGYTFQAGQPAWLRVTSLDPGLDRLLTDPAAGWLPLLRHGLPIYRTNWAVEAIAFDAPDHPWAGRCPEQALFDSAANPHPPHKWQILFNTPTAFHGANDQFLFPLPELLIKKWSKRWQEVFPQHPLWALSASLESGCWISNYALHTVHLGRHNGDQRYELTGFVGQVTLSTHDLQPEARAALDALAAFAFFAGTGYQVKRGLGQTRLLQSW